MKTFLKSILFTMIFAGVVLPMRAEAAYSDPLPNAKCVDGVLTIYLRPQGTSGRTAVRLDNLSNGWGGDTVLQGDVVNNNVTNSAYILNGASIGTAYGWWFHTVDSTGKYGPAQSGNVYCSVHSPINTAQSYTYPNLTLSWQPVTGAVRYAIRIDDVELSPTVYKPIPFSAAIGDRANDSITTTSFTFSTPRNRKFTWWVYAIDKNGVYSAPSRTLTIRTN